MNEHVDNLPFGSCLHSTEYFSVYLTLALYLHYRLYPCGRNKRQGLDPFIFSIKDTLHIHKRHGTFYYRDTTTILRLSLLVRL